MFVPVPNGVRVVHVGRIGTVEIINTIGVQNGDLSLANPVVASALSAIAKSHGDAWRAQIVPQLVNKYQHVNTYAYSLEDQSAPVGDAAYSGPVSGATNFSPAALHTCMVVSFHTNKRGRTYAGRSFLTGIANVSIDVDGKSWTPGTVTNVQAAFERYKGAVDPAVGHNGRMAVCSKGSPTKGINPHVEPVTSVQVRALIGTQRRRLV